jgi:hypothetical protein
MDCWTTWLLVGVIYRRYHCPGEHNGPIAQSQRLESTTFRFQPTPSHAFDFISDGRQRIAGEWNPEIYVWLNEK